MILHRTQPSTLFGIRMTVLHRCPGLLTQHGLCALNVPVSSADPEAERALNS